MISADDLKTDAEKIADAARMARLIKRARRVRIYFNVIGGAFGAYFIFGYLGNTQPWVWEYAVGLLAFVFLSAMVVGHIAEKTFARIEGLGQPATFREQSFPDTLRPPADTPAASAVTASVPRLDLLRGAAEAQVLTAALMEGPSVFVTAAGRAGTAPGRLPVGVGMFTRNGFAFLPDAEPDSARALQELGGAAWEVAKVVYGDRINEHGEEILAELNKRVTEWMSEAKPDLEGVCRAAMAPVLPHYARIPQIVANQPWLFVVPAADGAAAGV